LVAEALGTFTIVLFATAPKVLKIRFFGSFESWSLALFSGIGVALVVKWFVKISKVHFNPAITLGFLITGIMPQKNMALPLIAQTIGAFSASLIVKYIIGTEANLGANVINYSYSLQVIFFTELAVTAFLIAIIFTSVHTKGLKGLGWIASGAVVGLDIFFFSFVSGAAINPIRYLAPAVLQGYINDIWLYWTATFVGSALAAESYIERAP
jgi:glycerol uptake facilitator-like aquaporin